MGTDTELSTPQTTTRTKRQLALEISVKPQGYDQPVSTLPRLTYAPCARLIIGRGRGIHRSPTDPRICLPEEETQTSRLHAIVEPTLRRGRPMVQFRDCSSANSSFVGDLQAHEFSLKDGLRVRLGEHHLRTEIIFHKVAVIETPTSDLWEGNGYGLLDGKSPARCELFMKIHRRLKDLSPATPLVLQGSRGTGKKQVACEIARRLRRGIVILDCSALSRAAVRAPTYLSEQTLPSVLRQQRGKVVYIEGIADASRDRQEELYEILRAKRAGTNDDNTILIVAVHQELWALLDTDRASRDLYGELTRSDTLVVPTLIECGADEVEFLAGLFLKSYESLMPRAGPTAKFKGCTFHESAIALLRGEPLPRNIQQLQAIIEGSALRVAIDKREGPQIYASDVQLQEQRLEPRIPRILELSWLGAGGSLSARDEFYRFYIESLLVQTRGVMLRAAKQVGLTPFQFRQNLIALGLYDDVTKSLELKPNVLPVVPLERAPRDKEEDDDAT